MKNIKLDFSLLGAVACLAFTLAVVYGWVHNVISIINFTPPITGMIIARVVGVFVGPLGIILGYF